MPNNLEIKVNYQRAVEVAKHITQRLEKKLWPFNKKDRFPDAIPPKDVEIGSYDHSLFLFYSVSLDSMRESHHLYKNMRRLYEAWKGFKGIPTYDQQEIAHAIHSYIEKPKETNQERRLMGDPIETFLENSRILLIEYKNDPRILKQSNVEQTVKEISQFRGFGRQKSNLLVKNFVKAGIWQFPLSQVPIKIDRHVIKISLGSGVIRLPENLKEVRFDILVDPLEKVYRQAIEKEGINPIDLDDGFWAWGQYVCGQNDNLYCTLECPISCEVRPKSDRKFTTLQITEDCRKHTKNLFNL